MLDQQPQQNPVANALPEDAMIQFPNGELKPYKSGTPWDVIRADIQKAQGAGAGPPGLNLKPNVQQPVGTINPSDPFANFADTAKEVGSMALKAGEVGASFIPGLGPLPMAARVLLPALLGGTDSKLHGESFMSGAENQAMLGAGSELGARAFPYAGNKLALTLGGIGKDMQRKGEMASAFIRQRAKAHQGGRPGLAVGNQKGVKTAIERGNDELGRRIEDLTAQGIESPILNLSGAGDNLREGMSTAPVSRAGGVLAAEKKFMEEGAIAKQQINSGNKIAPLSKPLHPADMQQLVQDTKLTPRDLQDVKVSGAQKSHDVIEARKQGNLVDEDSEVRGAYQANLSKKANEELNSITAGRLVPTVKPRGLMDKVRFKLAGSPSTMPADLPGLNKDLSDIRLMNEANKKLTTNAGPVGTAMQIGARGALGSSLGYGVANATGADKTTSSTAGFLAGVLGINPRVMSAGGNMAGSLAEYLPALMRGISFEKQAEKTFTKTKRKDPK